ncbi:MAG: oligosaccharide flippase family protein, partial [Myxococcales bacterium]|nr:oligosaccharide flippase family protein [Myxococcales bacterium]
MSWLRDKLTSALGDDFVRGVAKGASWLLSANILLAIIGLLRGGITARYLGIDTYGELGLVIAFVTVVNGLLDFRVWEAVIKFISEYLGKGQTRQASAIFGLCLALDVATGLLAFGFVAATAHILPGYFSD